MLTPEKGERWGILGGAFDPVHNGHIRLARDIFVKKQLTGVLLVPTHRHPVKKDHVFAPFEDRVEMLKLAAAGHNFLVISEIEKQRSLSGYTLDTIRAVKACHPGVDFYFIIGADNIEQIISWRQPQEILREVKVVAGARPSFAADNSLAPLKEQIDYVSTEPVDVSSSEIRERIKQGETPEKLDPLIGSKVRAYIVERGLYQ